jgi:integrase/recombinase XerD
MSVAAPGVLNDGESGAAMKRATTVRPAERARHLVFVRGFARHRSATDSLTEMPSATLMPYRTT